MRYLALLAAIPLAACGSVAFGSNSGTPVTASGSGTTRSFDVAGFTAVDLRGFDDIDVRVGPAFSVRAEGPSEELDRLDIRKDGDTLKVGRKSESWGWHGKSKGVTVHVTLPRLAMASIAGSGNMAVDRVSGGDFSGSIAGSGDMTIGALASDVAKLSIAGSGNILARGQIQSMNVSIAGSGDVKAPGLTARQADISIAGSGGVDALVDGDAKISLMGSGDVSLGPKAKCATSKMGSGEVRCG